MKDFIKSLKNIDVPEGGFMSARLEIAMKDIFSIEKKEQIELIKNTILKEFEK